MTVRKKIIALRLIPFLLVIGGSFFLLPGTAKAQSEPNGTHYSIEGKWIDRAHIEITKFEFTDDEFLSEDGRSNGRDYVNQKLKELVVGKQFSADTLSPDEGERSSFFLDTKCPARSKIEVLNRDTTPSNNIQNNNVTLKDGNLLLPGLKTGCFAPIARSAFPSIRYLGFSPGEDSKNKIWFKQKSGVTGTIVRVDNGNEGDFTTDTNKKVFSAGVSRDCRIYVELKADPKNGENEAFHETCAGSASIVDPVIVILDDEKKAGEKPTSSDSTNGAAPDTECEVQLLNPLTWLMCPLIEGATLAVAQLDSAITSQLTVQTGENSIYDENAKDPTDPTKPGPGQALFNTWASFRYISLGVLVIVGLVMIISQALSFSIFDAYTIKKILPKILIGVIGISISWYVCKFLIDLFNDLGVGVRSLLYGPFKNMPGAKFDAGAVTLLGFGTAFAFVGLGVVGVLSFAATALLAVLIAFGILVFRQIVILLLVVTAPLAIVCWILPNTEKVWKMWSDFFMRALVVFPIIALFIAGGRVIAQIATLNTGQAGQSNILGSTIAFIAYFGPYFALPAAFRLAGGAIATIGGLANDRSRGVFDRLKKGRQERFSDRISRAGNERLYSTDMMDKFRASKAGQTRVGKKLGKVNTNKMATWVAAPHKNAAYKLRHNSVPFLSRYGEGLEEGIHHAALEQSVKGFQEVNDIGGNDKYYRVTGGMHGSLSSGVQAKLEAAGLHGRAMKSRSDFLAAADIMGQSMDHTEREAAGALRKTGAVSEKWRNDDDMNYADFGSIGMMGLAAHGFMDDPDLEKGGQLLNEKYGADYAGSVVTKSEMFGAQSNPFIKAGYGHTWVNKGGEGEEAKWELVRGSQAFRHLYNDDDWNSMDSGQVDAKGNKVQSDEQNVMSGRDLDVLDTLNYQSFAQMKGSNFRKHASLLKSVVKMGDSKEAEQAYMDTRNLAPEEVERVMNGAKNNKADFETMKKIRMGKAYKLSGQVKKQIAIAAMPQYGNDSDTAGQAQDIMSDLEIPAVGSDEAAELSSRVLPGAEPPAGMPTTGPPTSK